MHTALPQNDSAMENVCPPSEEEKSSDKRKRVQVNLNIKKKTHTDTSISNALLFLLLRVELFWSRNTVKVFS